MTTILAAIGCLYFLGLWSKQNKGQASVIGLILFFVFIQWLTGNA